MIKSILACFAHPDDEVWLGPLIARYVAEGVRATLICTTNGDVGSVDEEHLQSYSSIAELRLAELHCATKAIGFTEVVTFSYRDSGMMGSEDNQHKERGQTVISTGPYRYVRHPMYAGMLLFFIGVALLLGSWLGFGLFPVFIGALVIRAVREEEMLREELPGYDAYMAQVSYRFIPYVW